MKRKVGRGPCVYVSSPTQDQELFKRLGVDPDDRHCLKTGEQRKSFGVCEAAGSEGSAELAKRPKA